MTTLEADRSKSISFPVNLSEETKRTLTKKAECLTVHATDLIRRKLKTGVIHKDSVIVEEP